MQMNEDKDGLNKVKEPILHISPLVCGISELSQMMAHFFNLWSKEVEVNTKINVLNEMHTMTLRWHANGAKWENR